MPSRRGAGAVVLVCFFTIELRTRSKCGFRPVGIQGLDCGPVGTGVLLVSNRLAARICFAQFHAASCRSRSNKCEQTLAESLEKKQVPLLSLFPDCVLAAAAATLAP